MKELQICQKYFKLPSFSFWKVSPICLKFLLIHHRLQRMKELGKITFPTDVEKGCVRLVSGFLLCSAALSRWDPTLFEISENLVIGSGLDMEGFIVIMLTGTVHPLVLCVPHGMHSYFLDSHCWLTLTCQVHRSKAICGSQSLPLQNVWLGSPAGPVCSPDYGEWEVRFLDKNSYCIHAQWSI